MILCLQRAALWNARERLQRQLSAVQAQIERECFVLDLTRRDLARLARRKS